MDGLPFGELLTALRARRRISQQELARKLDVHRNTISKWERGVCLPESKALVLEVARQLRLDAQDTRRLLEASLTALSPYWQMPYPRNPFFTGREEVLQRLHEALHHDHSALLSQSYALSGLGGIGKTQTAIEYAYRYVADYSAVFWLGAETSESLLASFVAIADLLELPERQEQEQNRVVTAVIRWLNSHSGWLLILDNVEDPELVKSVLPAARSGALLFTSRRQALGLTARTLDLEQMTPEEGMRLLLQRARLLDSSTALEQLSEADWLCAQKIVTLLGGLPLALDQAGAYIEATGCSLVDYLRLFQAAQLHLLDERAAHDDHPLSVTRTFALAFAQLEQRNPSAIELLTVCAFLAPDAIPEDLFIEGVASLGASFEALAADPLQFHAAIKDLLTYSLIQRDAASHTLTVHRLVQVVLQERMSGDERARWRARVAMVLNAIFPDGSYETWKQCERLLPHVRVCAVNIPDHTDNLELAGVLLKAAMYLYQRAQYDQAESWFQCALRIRERALGYEHPEVVAPLHELALLYRQQGKFMQAEPLFERVLHIWERTLGPEHPEVARVLNNLAILHSEQGRYEQAEPLFERALHIWECTLGPEHPHVARVLNNLGELSRKKGRYEQAELLFQRALYIWEHALGPGHPVLAYALNGLANLSIERGSYEKAEQQFERARSIVEQTLGPEHPQTAQIIHDLAICILKQGRLYEAASLFECALSIRAQSLGDAHSETVATRTLYTQLLQEQVTVEEKGSAQQGDRKDSRLMQERAD